jgi:hypothetical protein
MDSKNMDPKKMPKRKRDLSNLPLIGYQLLIFLVQIFILVACIEYTQILYNNNILPDKQVKDNYVQASCLVLDKKLSQKGRLIHRYRADFQLSYTVNENPYKTWATGNGLDQAYFRDRSAQEETLAQFEIGQTYPCWYNPQIPQLAVLVLRHDWASTMPLIVPTVVGLIAIYYILKGIFKFFGLISLILQEKKRYKK